MDTAVTESLLGYVKRVDTEQATYFFTTDDEASNMALVLNGEAIIATAAQFDLPRFSKPLNLYYHTERGDSLIGSGHSRIILYTDNDESLGGLVSLLSDYHLPAWFSAGLEQYWRTQDSPDAGQFADSISSEWVAEVKASGLPDFGDAWFVPGLITGEWSVHAKELARQFVGYLDEQADLGEIISMFMDANPSVQVLLNQHWQAFTRSPDEQLDFRYHYTYLNESIHFKVHTERTTYRFFYENWEYGQVADYVAYMDESIGYVEEWLGEELAPEWVYDIYPHPNFRRGEADLNLKTVRLYDVMNIPPRPTAHETVHAITFQMIEGNTSFFILSWKDWLRQ